MTLLCKELVEATYPVVVGTVVGLSAPGLVGTVSAVTVSAASAAVVVAVTAVAATAPISNQCYVLNRQ